MRATGNRKTQSSRTSAGRAANAPAPRLEDMDRVRVDADRHRRADRRQGAARRLADDQLEAVVAGQSELESRTEIDRLRHLSREEIGAAVEPLGPHQNAHLPACFERLADPQ